MAISRQQALSVQAVVQKPDYSLQGVEDFQKTTDSAVILLVGRLTDFIPDVLAETGDCLSAPTETVDTSTLLARNDVVDMCTLLTQRNFAEWNKACTEFTASTLPMGVGVCKEANFCSLVNGYQGKYKVPALKGHNENRRHLIKSAHRAGSEQLLRRLFEIDGKVIYNPFGGLFLGGIQDLPYVVKFWLVLRNIAEVAPRMKSGEDVTINYFAQLFAVKADDGRNLYAGLQEATQELWGCRFQPEAMDLEQKMRKTDEANLLSHMEEVVLDHSYEFSFDDFGTKHLAWFSQKLQMMKLKEVKMSAEMKANVVDQLLQGESTLLAEWMAMVAKIGDFKCVVLEGSDNCGGKHPGVIFTDETRAAAAAAIAAAPAEKSPAYPAEHLQKYTQDQVEDAHASLVEKIQSAFPEKTVYVQGGFGVLEKEVDGAFANVCAKLGESNVAPKLGSTAWLTWANGKQRSTEMGLGPR